MAFELFSKVALREDFPRHQLHQGDMATIVDHHQSAEGEDGYSLEVFNESGETTAVLVVEESQIAPLLQPAKEQLAPMTQTKSPVKVFISYSHRNEALKEDLESHLASLRRAGKIQLWQDRAIDAGSEWNEQIRTKLDAADIILLLITAQFINSDFCFSKEMTRAMLRHEQGTASVIPIIMAPCVWSEAPFAKLQVLPRDGKPVTDTAAWSTPDLAYVNVVEGIARVVNKRYGSPEKPDDGWSTPPIASARDDAWSATPVGTPSNSAPGTDTTTPAPQSKIQQRMELFQLLSDIPGVTFDTLLYGLQVPPSSMPSAMAPQGERVAALLKWVQSPVGCGLDDLQAVVRAVVKS